MPSMDLELTKHLYEKDKHTIGCMFLFFSTFNGKNIFQLFFFLMKRQHYWLTILKYFYLKGNLIYLLF